MVSYRWHKVLETSKVQSFKENKITGQMVDGKSIVLTKLDGEFFVLDNYCPHKGGPLANGTFDDQGYIVCPWHKYQYHPKTGQSPPGYDDPPAKHYRTELRADGLYVSFPSAD